MTTVAHDNMRGLAKDIEDVPDLPSAINSGIVGDPAHMASGGYHVSYEDNPPGNYSTTRPGDKPPDINGSGLEQATAIDTSMSTPDMVTSWYRVEAVWKNQSDPRRKYFNAFNGWNGKGKAERLDFIANTRKPTSDDHKWHCHKEITRKYYKDPEMRRAVASVFRGETVDQFLATGLVVNGMQMMVKGFEGDPDQIWLVDGMFARQIPDDFVGPVGNGQTHQSGFLGNLGNGGNVYTSGGDVRVWGEPIQNIGGDVTLSAEAVVEALKADPEFKALIVAAVNEAEDS